MIVPDLPNVIELELSMRCNKSCRMCQRHWIQPDESRPDLSFGLLDRILKQIKNKNVQINLGGLGESLLVEFLPVLLMRIKEYDPSIRTGINTNGILLTKDKWQWITDGRLDFITISLNTADKLDYLWLVGDDTYPLICFNTIKFLRYKGQGKLPFTTVHCFDLPRFRSKIRAFKEFWAGLADNVQIRPLANWGGVVQISQFGAKIDTAGVCQRPWFSLAIDTQGGYHFCCSSFLMNTTLQAIDGLTIHEFWHGMRMSELRTAMQSGNLDAYDLCLLCNAKKQPPNTLLEQLEHNGLKGIMSNEEE